MPPYLEYHRDIFCPILVVLGLLVVATLWRMFRLLRRRPRGQLCAKCGYDLRGHIRDLPATVLCPECGTMTALKAEQHQPFKGRTLRAIVGLAGKGFAISSGLLLFLVAIPSFISIWKAQTATISWADSYMLNFDHGTLWVETRVGNGERDWARPSFPGADDRYWAAFKLEAQEEWEWIPNRAGFSAHREAAFDAPGRYTYQLQAPIWCIATLLSLAPAGAVLQKHLKRRGGKPRRSLSSPP